MYIGICNLIRFYYFWFDLIIIYKLLDYMVYVKFLMYGLIFKRFILFLVEEVMMK